jgi:hypothetical protein
MEIKKETREVYIYKEKTYTDLGEAKSARLRDIIEELYRNFEFYDDELKKVEKPAYINNETIALWVLSFTFIKILTSQEEAYESFQKFFTYSDYIFFLNFEEDEVWYSFNEGNNSFESAEQELKSLWEKIETLKFLLKN